MALLSDSGESLDSYMDTDGRFRPSRELVVKVGVRFIPSLGDDEVLSEALVAGAGDPRQAGVVPDDDRLPPTILPNETVPAAGEDDDDD